jgi:hypothetical protein
VEGGIGGFDGWSIRGNIRSFEGSELFFKMFGGLIRTSPDVELLSNFDKRSASEILMRDTKTAYWMKTFFGCKI